MLRPLPWLLVAAALLVAGVIAVAEGFALSGGALVLLAATPLAVGLGAGLAHRLDRR